MYNAYYSQTKTLINRLISQFVLLTLGIASALAQDGPQRVFMYLDYYQSDDYQYLVSEVKYRTEGEFLQLSDVVIDFYVTSDTSQIKLGSVTTGVDGKARFDLDESTLIRDEEGFAHLQSSFEGNEGFRSANKELATKRVMMVVEDEVQDSVMELTVNASELVNGEEVEVTDADLSVFVKRTYSNLPVAEGSFEDGSFSLEFPSDIPGDANGNLSVIVKIIEHDDYGTVEANKQLPWGIPVSQTVVENPRALWSRDAPLWILIAVLLSFSAAWYHYFLAISKLFKMPKQ